MLISKRCYHFVNQRWPNLRHVAVTLPWSVQIMMIISIPACAPVNREKYVPACILFIITITIIIMVTSVSFILKWLIGNQFRVVYLLLKLYFVVTESISLSTTFECADPAKNPQMIWWAWFYYMQAVILNIFFSHYLIKTRSYLMCFIISYQMITCLRATSGQHKSRIFQ